MVRMRPMSTLARSVPGGKTTSQNVVDSSCGRRKPGCETNSTVTSKQPTLPIREKKTRKIDFWITESDYFRLLELGIEDDTFSAVARKALKVGLATLRRRRANEHGLPMVPPGAGDERRPYG